MNNYLQHWQQAVADLKHISQGVQTASQEDIQLRDDLIQQIAKIRDDLKYATGSDKVSLLQELGSLNQRLTEVETKIRASREGAGNPYFAKVTSDEGFFISKHFTDLDRNVVKYTAPIASLRYREIGESAEVNGFRHQVREKQQLVIKDARLMELTHHDTNGSFICDAEKYKELVAEEQAQDITVDKDSLQFQQPQTETDEKKYVLGEIIAKMREEQDLVMRAPARGVTLVKGAAGSGKTNIAFHRIVYLTSEFPDDFRQDNIAVFCFNVALKQYLSNMLEELNIPGVQVHSLDDWLFNTVRYVTNIDSINYKEDHDLRFARTRAAMLPVLEKFYTENKRRLLDLVDFDPMMDELAIDGLKILNQLYVYQPFIQHLKLRDDFGRGKYVKTARIEASDLYILAWMVYRLSEEVGANCFGYYDHIVVDEVQDFMPVQMALINQLHKNSMTIVGDVTQKIYQYGVDSWQEFDLKIDRTHELTMCHRSTLETILFANDMLHPSGDQVKSTTVGRRGLKPVVSCGRSRTDALKKAVSFVQEIKDREPEASLAVLSYRNFDLNWIDKTLSEAGIDSYIASRRDWEFSPKVAVTTYHQVKGLEFDYVVVLGLNDYEQLEAANREQVVYTVVTRAQKQVFIGYVKKLPEMLKSVDTDLYQHVK